MITIYFRVWGRNTGDSNLDLGLPKLTWYTLQTVVGRRDHIADTDRSQTRRQLHRLGGNWCIRWHFLFLNKLLSSRCDKDLESSWL